MLIEKNDKKLFLAPLDFDLAFFRDEFIHLNYTDDKNVQNKEEKNAIFNDLITTEKTNLLIQLTGINCIENIDVAVLNLETCQNANNKKYYHEIESLKNLLLENFHYYFALGYNFIENEKTEKLKAVYDEGVDFIKFVLLWNELN